jgi:hypothetical protein
MYFAPKRKSMRAVNRKLEERVTDLERQLRTMKSQLKAVRKASRKPWWEELAGRFKNDPLFDEISEAGQAYRRALARRTR